jgi:hypothetical protein
MSRLLGLCCLLLAADHAGALSGQLVPEMRQLSKASSAPGNGSRVWAPERPNRVVANATVGALSVEPRTNESAWFVAARGKGTTLQLFALKGPGAKGAHAAVLPARGSARPWRAGIRREGGGQLALENRGDVDGWEALLEEDTSLAGRATMGKLKFKASASAVFRIVVGVLFIAIAILIQWFNEVRSVHMVTLVSRGEAECVTVSSEKVDPNNRGKLVHVQGRATGARPVVDQQFEDAIVTGCLKLQSTVEIFEWVQTTRTWLDERKEKRSQPRFHTEWSTTHHDSLRFKKPSPDNPRVPSGLLLGTFTESCKRVELGAFALSDFMVKSFLKFEPAMPHLPSIVTAHGMTYFANTSDGYYYARPGLTAPAGSAIASAGLFGEPQVGDVRVRFLCVPEGEATVVAVQCQKSHGIEGFVPYRPIPRVPCFRSFHERLIEEGERPLEEFRREQRRACCCTSSGPTSWACCCTCNAIANICSQEIITEEIMYVSDELDPREKPFMKVVPRSSPRVWGFRIIGFIILFFSVYMVVQPFKTLLQEAPLLTAYGGGVSYLISAVVTLEVFFLILATAYSCYLPMVSLRWFLAMGVVIAAPLVYGSWWSMHQAA